MTEIPKNPGEPQATPVFGRTAPESARMGTFSRYLNVFSTPGAVFEDIRRRPGGWWLPILVGAMLFAILASIHVARYDQALIVEQQIKENPFLKLAPPEAQEKALEQAVKGVRLTPAWHTQLSYFGWTPLGYTASVLFFTFLYSLIALMMGWMPELRASKLFLNLGIALTIGLVLVGVSAITAVVGGGAGMGREVHAPASWSPVVTTLAAWAATAGLFFLIRRTSRDLSYGRVFSAVSYATSPSAVAFLVGILIILLRTPDATPVQEIIPSNLGALLDPKVASKWLVSFTSSLDLFSLWSIVLTIIGLSKVLGRKTGEAAAMVLIPWGAWVLLKTGFAALTG